MCFRACVYVKRERERNELSTLFQPQRPPSKPPESAGEPSAGFPFRQEPFSDRALRLRLPLDRPGQTQGWRRRRPGQHAGSRL